MSQALLTDHYELTMLRAAIADGTADQPCVFEAFSRRLPPGRRYGVVAGTGRIVDAISTLRYETDELEFLTATGVIDAPTREWLANYRFTGDVDGYPEGELYFPGSPVLTVTAPFGAAVVLETLVLSMLNHDCAVASAAARMSVAAGDRPMIEMGSRRTHEESAVAAARAAYLGGFSATSNLAAGLRHGIPTAGTAAHSFTLLHEREADAFAAQIATLGTGTTLLVDTYDIAAGIRTAIEVAGTELGAIRIDSGDLGVMAHHARAQLDELGAHRTKIVVSGDLDEYAMAALAAAPVDSYGAGTAVVTGSGAPTAEMVYKLVDVDGRAVAKRSEHKGTRGGRKRAWRRYRSTGTAVEEVLETGGTLAAPEPLAGAAEETQRRLQVPLIRGGAPAEGNIALVQAREQLRHALVTVPWDGLKLSAGDPAIPTVYPSDR